MKLQSQPAIQQQTFVGATESIETLTTGKCKKTLGGARVSELILHAEEWNKICTGIEDADSLL